jgi:hypothetical protein
VVTTDDATLLAVVVHATIAATPASKAQPMNSRTKKESGFTRAKRSTPLARWQLNLVERTE